MEQVNSRTEQDFLSAYDRLSDQLFRFFAFKLGDREKAKDALQEIFARTWNYLREGKKIENIDSFLWRTSTNYVTDEWRRKKAIPMSALSSENEDGETEFDVADEKEEILPKAEYDRVVRLFAELEDTDSQVLQMRFVEDLPIKDIARILGERENTVAVRINRALAKLKKIST